MLRASSSASVAALIMPRSATTPMRAIRKRTLSRSMTGKRVVTSVVLPGHSSEQIGRPRPSMTTASTTCFKSGRWSFEWPYWPRLWPPAPSKESEVVSRNTRLSSLNRLLRKANSRSSTRSLVVRGPRPRPLWSASCVAEPAHGAVELMQFEIADPSDDQPTAPLLGAAVGARVEQPMQHGQKHRAFESPLKRAFAAHSPVHPPAAGLLPQPLESERRAELAGRHFRGLAALVGGQHHGAVGKARTGAQQPIEGAVLRQFVDPAERGDDRLARLAVDALVLDDLEIFGVPGALVAEEHGGPRFNHHVLAVLAAKLQPKTIDLWHYVNAKF